MRMALHADPGGTVALTVVRDAGADLRARGVGGIAAAPAWRRRPGRAGPGRHGANQDDSFETAKPRSHGSRWAMSNVPDSNIRIISAWIRIGAR